MQFDLVFRRPDGRTAEGILVELKLVPRPNAPRRAILNAPTLAQGRTDGSGLWSATADLAGPEIVALILRAADGADPVALIGPVAAARLAERREIALGRDTATPEPAIEPAADTDPAPDQPAPQETRDRPRRRRDPIARRQRKSAEEAALRAQLSPQAADIRAALAKRRKGKDIAHGLVGKKPGKGRARPGRSFVPAGTDPAPALAETRQRSLDRLQSGEMRRNGLRIPANVLPDGVRPEPGKPMDPALSAALAQSLLARGKPAAPLSPLQACRARHRAAAATRQMEAARTPDANAKSAPAPVAAQLNVQSLLAQALVGPAAAPSPTQRPDQVTVSQDLAGSLVPTGPADSVAYYDFNLLQVAWEDTWTAVIDADVESTVAELYDSIVALVPAERDDDKFAKELEEVDELDDLLDTIAQAASVLSASLQIPPEIAAWSPAVADVWLYLTDYERAHVEFLYALDTYCVANDTIRYFNPNTYKYEDRPNTADIADLSAFDSYPDDWLPDDLTVAEAATSPRWALTVAAEIAADAKTAGGARLGRVTEMLTDLKRKIAKPYAFDVFVPDSCNYGIVTTYRQEWTPRDYQPGDLAGTITLAPNEKRTYTIRRKTTSRQSRQDAWTQGAVQTRATEETSRTEAEIARNTQNRLSASTGASAGFNMVVDFQGSAEFGFDQSMESAQAKTEIREATRKASQEYRDERKVEITAESTGEDEYSEQREITNPNNELTVTYLLYELQRQYTVAERLYDVYPVILVAFDLPQPHLVDEAWLIEYEWIIRKVLLDPTMQPTLRLLSQDFAGDEVAVEALGEQWKVQIAIVSELRTQVEAHVDMRELARNAIERAARRARAAQAEAEKKGFWDTVGDIAMVATGGVGGLVASELLDRVTDDPDRVPVPAEEDSARQALDWADADLGVAEGKLRDAVTALDRATDKYIAAVRTRLNRRVEIDRLILHVKSNILHYMQAIWMHEHPDARYLRLYDIEVPWPGDEPRIVWKGPMGSSVPGISGALRTVPSAPRIEPAKPDVLFPDAEAVVRVPTLAETRKLHQIAHLDRIVGFRGNYAVFRLREMNALTLHLVQDFLDAEFGLMDPDPFGRLPTAEEALELAECAWNTEGITEDQKAQVAEWLVQALEAAYKVSQDIVVPTGQLFIEALPGSHPLLEDFKLQHRAYDSQKASAEARMAEVELLRKAARLQSGDLADPDVDRTVRIEGGVVPTLPVDGG